MSVRLFKNSIIKRSTAAKCAAAALTVVGMIAGGLPALASMAPNPDGLHTSGSGPTTASPPAAVITVFLNPYTIFQEKYASTGNGNIYNNTNNLVGPLIGVQKLYYLDRRLQADGTYGDYQNHTAFVFGGYFWQNDANHDRLTAYSQYFFNQHVGVEGDIGGDTHLGLYEYYFFALYNVLNANYFSDNATHKTRQWFDRIAIQLGVGPYIPRTSLGDAGYTDQAQIAYALTPAFSIEGTAWYLNYRQKFPAYGYDKTSTTARYSVGVAYSF